MIDLDIIDEAITIRQAVAYKIAGSWWAHLIGSEWGQTLAARYFLWKVKRKYARYQRKQTWMASLLKG